MKKVLICLISLLLIAFTACSNNESKNTNAGTQQSEKPVKESVEQEIKAATVDGVTYTIKSVSKEDVTGDYDAEGNVVDNGEYFDNGAGYVKASDYYEYTVNYNIENNSGKILGYTNSVWDISLQDGYKVDVIYGADDFGLKQIQSNKSKDEKFNMIIEKNVEVESLILKYPFLDYNQEYWEDIGKAFTGEIDQKQYKEKYTNKVKKMDFKIRVN